jgi:translocator protein
MTLPEPIKRRPTWWPVLIAFLAAAMVAGLGASVTEIGPWYHGLNKPSWQPPDWLFGPAWTLIFACAALSASTAWMAARSRIDREWIVGLFCLNGFLNVLWSLLFFRLHLIGWAGLEVVALWLSILALILLTRRYSTTASLLLLPYLAWVAFAAVLNWTVISLN